LTEAEVNAKLREAVRERSEAIREEEGFWRHLFLYRIFGQKIKQTSLWADSTGFRLHSKVYPVCSDCGANAETGKP